MVPAVDRSEEREGLGNELGYTAVTQCDCDTVAGDVGTWCSVAGGGDTTLGGGWSRDMGHWEDDASETGLGEPGVFTPV